MLWSHLHFNGDECTSDNKNPGPAGSSWKPEKLTFSRENLFRTQRRRHLRALSRLDDQLLAIK